MLHQVEFLMIYGTSLAKFTPNFHNLPIPSQKISAQYQMLITSTFDLCMLQNTQANSHDLPEMANSQNYSVASWSNFGVTLEVHSLHDSSLCSTSKAYCTILQLGVTTGVVQIMAFLWWVLRILHCKFELNEVHFQN